MIRLTTPSYVHNRFQSDLLTGVQICEASIRTAHSDRSFNFIHPLLFFLCLSRRLHTHCHKRLIRSLLSKHLLCYFCEYCKIRHTHTSSSTIENFIVPTNQSRKLFIMLFAIAFTLLVAVVKAAPIPDGGSAYTGAGGTAVGGSKSGYANSYGGGVADNADVLNIAGDNAGDGGKANSGNAFGGDGSSG